MSPATYAEAQGCQGGGASWAGSCERETDEPVEPLRVEPNEQAIVAVADVEARAERLVTVDEEVGRPSHTARSADGVVGELGVGPDGVGFESMPAGEIVQDTGIGDVDPLLEEQISQFQCDALARLGAVFVGGSRERQGRYRRRGKRGGIEADEQVWSDALSQDGDLLRDHLASERFAVDQLERPGANPESFRTRHGVSPLDDPAEADVGERADDVGPHLDPSGWMLAHPASLRVAPRPSGSWKTDVVDDHGLNISHYSAMEERSRLYADAAGALERLRTWDVLERWLPPTGVVYDIGGAAGVHAGWLADRGYEVELFDPVPLHVRQAREASEAKSPGRQFSAEEADARAILRADESADVVMLMGPLYHLTDEADRATALAEAWRLLRDGGQLLAAGISRFSWLMDAYRQGLASDPAVQGGITYTVENGRSRPDPTPGAFWAHFHRPDELTYEIADAGFTDVGVVGVEGFAWMLTDLAELLDDRASRDALLDQLRRIEREPSLLGASGHLLALATKPPA